MKPEEELTVSEQLAEALDHIKRLIVALKPFSDFAINVEFDGDLNTNAWKSRIHRESISTWFGPSDFAYAAFAVGDTNDRLPAIAASPKQEAIFWYRPVGVDGGYEGPYHSSSEAGKSLRASKADEWKPLYAHPQKPEATEGVSDDNLAYNIGLEIRYAIAASGVDPIQHIPEVDEIIKRRITEIRCSAEATEGGAHEKGLREIATELLYALCGELRLNRGTHQDLINRARSALTAKQTDGSGE